MNRLIVSICILAGLSVISFGSIKVTDMFANRMLELVDEVEDSFEQGNSQRCLENAEELQSLWQEFMDFSILLNDMGHAVEITSCVAEICSFAEEGNEELYAVCDRTQAQLELLKDAQVPTLWRVL